MNMEKYIIFSWSNYIMGTLEKLNQLPYVHVKNYIQALGGIMYPCDVYGREVKIV
jgi:hypothetical protein